MELLSQNNNQLFINDFLLYDLYHNKFFRTNLLCVLSSNSANAAPCCNHQAHAYRHRFQNKWGLNASGFHFLLSLEFNRRQHLDFHIFALRAVSKALLAVRCMSLSSMMKRQRFYTSGTMSKAMLIRVSLDSNGMVSWNM